MPNQTILIDSQLGNVTTPTAQDKVTLLGTQLSSDSYFTQNLELIISPSNGIPEIKLHIPEEGYYMQIFLGDFTGDGKADIMVRGDSGGTGNFAIAKIYTYRNGELREIFNQSTWNAQHTCTTEYKDNCQLQIDCQDSSSPFFLNLSDYPEQCSPPYSSSVSYLNEVFPIKPTYQPTYNLLLEQRIVGNANAVTLGYIQTQLAYTDSKFTAIDKGIVLPAKNATRNDISLPSTQNPFYSIVEDILKEASASLAPHIYHSLMTKLNTLHTQESLLPSSLSTRLFRKTQIPKAFRTTNQLHRLLTQLASKEYADSNNLSSSSPDLISLQLRKSSLLLCLDSHLRNLNQPYREMIYYGNEFNINPNNLDLIVNSITEDSNTLYVDSYIANLTNVPISRISDFTLTLSDQKGRVFATKTFYNLDIGNSLRPYQGKRIFLSFFRNEYSLFDVDTSNISWNYTYHVS